MNQLQALSFLQDSYRHPNSSVQMLWTTRDQLLILISSLGSTGWFYVKIQFILNNITPTNINFILKHGSVSEIEQRSRTGSVSAISSTPHNPFGSQNLQSSHNAVGTLLKIKHVPHSVQTSPQRRTSRMSCHTTTQKS
jgi:hypothetical protein